MPSAATLRACIACVPSVIMPSFALSAKCDSAQAASSNRVSCRLVVAVGLEQACQLLRRVRGQPLGERDA